MEDDKICARSGKCPIYTGVLQSKEVLVQTYKNLYCEKGVEGRRKCKRFQVAEVAGSCPPDILPNNNMSVNDIIKRMNSTR